MIDAITQLAAPTPDQTQKAAFTGLDKDAFLKLLVAQLRYQNPMSPADGKEYLAQAAQFATVEKLDNIDKAQHEVVAYQQILLSQSMVGRTVTGTPRDGQDPVTGVVESVRFKFGAPLLVIDGREVPVGSVEEVKPPT
jgi:flagellar basal-body rod modification protein FlgD